MTDKATERKGGKSHERTLFVQLAIAHGYANGRHIPDIATDLGTSAGVVRVTAHRLQLQHPQARQGRYMQEGPSQAATEEYRAHRDYMRKHRAEKRKGRS